jgi:excisionase family DNA binding protein
MFISIAEASMFLGCSISTLRRWDKSGTLVAARTAGGHRRYNLNLLKEMFGIPKSDEKLTIGNTRVSSSDQRDDLVRQEERLLKECQKTKGLYEVISDLGSGINFKKKACAGF